MCVQGEGFGPKGVSEFLSGLIIYTSQAERGKKITKNRLVIKRVFCRTGAKLLGLLWVFQGEGLSLKGVSEFLAGLITCTKAKLKEAKNYQQQVSYKEGFFVVQKQGF